MRMHQLLCGSRVLNNNTSLMEKSEKDEKRRRLGGSITCSEFSLRREKREELPLHTDRCFSSSSPQSSEMAPAVKPITSPVPDAWYPFLAFVLLAIGLVVTASFFIYEATSSKRSRSISKELTTGTVASIFLGFGSLFLLLATGVYV